MYHSRPQTDREHVVGHGQEEAVLTDLAGMGLHGRRLRSIHGVTSTSVVIRLAGSPISSIPSVLPSGGSQSVSATRSARSRTMSRFIVAK